VSELIELYKRLGLSPQLLAERLRIDPRTVKKRLADGKMTRSLRRKIRAATRHERETLVSEVGNIILENYREHKDKYLYPDEYDLLRFIEDHLVIVDFLRSQNAYEKAEFMYILGHLNYSRAFHGHWVNRVGGKALRASAQEAFRIYNDEAPKLVRGTDLQDLTEEQASRRSSFLDLLELNAMETKWQMAKHRHVSLQECLKWLDEQNVLGRLRAASLVPHNVGVWTIPHNGLIFASQLNRVEEMKFFYGKLVEVQPGFSDWDFSPGETQTLRQDDDLEAFRQAFPNLDNRNSKKETSMTTKITAAAAAITLTILASSGLTILLTGLAIASNMIK
jgi:hypothetical protein